MVKADVRSFESADRAVVVAAAVVVVAAAVVDDIALTLLDVLTFVIEGIDGVPIGRRPVVVDPSEEMVSDGFLMKERNK